MMKRSSLFFWPAILKVSVWKFTKELKNGQIFFIKWRIWIKRKCHPDDYLGKNCQPFSDFSLGSHHTGKVLLRLKHLAWGKVFCLLFLWECSWAGALVIPTAVIGHFLCHHWVVIGEKAAFRDQVKACLGNGSSVYFFAFFPVRLWCFSNPSNKTYPKRITELWKCKEPLNIMSSSCFSCFVFASKWCAEFTSQIAYLFG